MIEETTYKILVPVCHIPSKAKVTKRTGTKVYTLERYVKVKAQRKGKDVEVIYPSGDDGGGFIYDNGTMYYQHGDKEMIWHVSEHDLGWYLQAPVKRTEKKPNAK